MNPVHAEVEIDAPRERVYEVITDLAWRPAFTEPYQQDFHLERIESRGIGAAARYRARPGKTWFATEIAVLQPPHLVVERGATGTLNRVPTTTVWELVETPLGLTRVSLTFFTRPERLVDRVREVLGRASRVHRRGWSESLQRLRALLEEEGAEMPRLRIAGGNRHQTGIA